jgi:hypothetical protein
MINFQYLEITNVIKSCEILVSHSYTADDSDLFFYTTLCLWVSGSRSFEILVGRFDT